MRVWSFRGNGLKLSAGGGKGLCLGQGEAFPAVGGSGAAGPPCREELRMRRRPPRIASHATLGKPPPQFLIWDLCGNFGGADNLR